MRQYVFVREATEGVADLRHPLFSLAVHLYTSILLPLLHSLWVLSGTGNANFFYAATMVYGLNASLAVVDVLGALLRHGVQLSVIDSGLLANVRGKLSFPSEWPADLAIVQLTSSDA